MNRVLFLSALLSLAGIGAAAAGPDPSARTHERAEALYQQALGWLTENTVASRRQAVSALEEATLLEPKDATRELALARAYYASGFLEQARRRLEHVTLLEPDDSALHLELGLLWRSDWLRYLDRRSLQRATIELVSATILDTTNTDAWLTLQPLLLVQDNVGVALAAAFRAARSDPSRLEAHLAVAAVCQRIGLTREADSIFMAVIPHLRAGARARFEDISPVAPEAEVALLRRLPDAEKGAEVERFWNSRDPDPSVPGNGARAEFYARATQAYFLFFDEQRGDWDERGVAFVRYGPPAEMTRDPVGERLSVSFAAGPEYPTAVQVWTYPETGMKVTLQDRSLIQDYRPPVTRVVGMGHADPLLPDYLTRQTRAGPDQAGDQLKGVARNTGIER
jgi:GWxTD domain-containing protein